MPNSTAREVGSPFTDLERRLLEKLCAGEGPKLEQAREQLAHATWGGTEFDDCDCFLIQVNRQPGMKKIRHRDGPLRLLEVVQDGKFLGPLELWVVSGYLHSADYIPFDDHSELPDPSLVDPN